MKHNICVMINQTQKKEDEKNPRSTGGEKSSDRTAAGPYETKWPNNKKEIALLHCYVHIQTMKPMTNGATLIKKGAAELHKLPPRCEDHPALVDDDAAEAEVTADALLLMLLLVLLVLVEPVVVVPAEGRAVEASTAVEVLSVEVGGVTELGIERDVVGSVTPGTEPEDADEDELPESGEEIRVMAKAGLVSPESPSTRIQTRML